MSLRKRGFLLKVGFIFLILFIFIKPSSALGVGPAKIEVNFEPGFERTLTYKVLGADDDQELELYTAGDLPGAVKLDRDKMTGSGEFNVYLKLPEVIETPGKHRILIGVREKLDEELANIIGTVVAIQVVIDVFVPYPGRYVDLTFNSKDANVGEPIRFDLELISQGDEDVIISPRIDIIDDNKTLETLLFQVRELKSQEKLPLKKFLDTTNYNPGTYKGVARVDYGSGSPAEAETVFRIGELIINIVNHTRKITIDKVQGFDVEIESGWNNAIDTVNAEISIFNDSEELINFRTSSIDLTPWEKKTITGFFDTSNFTQGVYDVNITLFYFGKEQGKTSTKLSTVELVEKSFDKMIVIYIVGGIVLLIIAIFLMKKFLFSKNAKRK